MRHHCSVECSHEPLEILAADRVGEIDGLLDIFSDEVCQIIDLVLREPNPSRKLRLWAEDFSEKVLTHLEDKAMEP